MNRFATLPILVIFIAFSAAQMAASTPTAQPSKTAPAGKLNQVAPNTIFNFAVSDASGVLLTCAKQQRDSDTFSGCTLAQGRTLDDLMTSIVRTIRAVQQKVNDAEK
jgi:hypothetical protein